MNQELSIHYSAHIVAFQKNLQEVLLVKHGEQAGHITGVYGLPGGHIEPDENKKVTAARELEEETGLAVNLSDVYEFPDNEYSADIQRKDGIKHFTMTVFTTQKASGLVKDTSETSPEWIEVGNLANYLLLPNVEKAIEAARKFWIKK